MQTNVFHTITRLIILIPLQCHGDSERKKEREEERRWERERVFQKQGWRRGMETREGGREEEREGAHQAKRSAVAVYFPMSS